MNKHIEDYLDYYCKLEYPSYAVLLKGQWGCGKSHFIGLYQRKTDKKFIYISLYGLKEVNQIDDALFQATHPRLGSKGMGLASKIIASSLKSAVKVDLSSGSAYLKKLLSKTKDSILIFDDLERCDIPLKQVFGYLNSFVEHEKRHVIIIADATKFNAQEEYLEIKEKLIGQELEVQLHIKAALENFCSEVKNEACEVFLIRCFDNICSIYIASKYNNLRTLRKFIQDFAYFFSKLPENAKDKSDLLQDILSVLLTTSLEMRSGQITLDQVKIFLEGSLSFVKKEREPKEIVLRNKYSNFLDFSPILGVTLWQDFFRTGILNQDKLHKAVFNTKYFQEESQESWIRLWHSLDLSDEDFEKVKEEVQTELDHCNYRKIPIITHVFGLYLWMSENHLCEMNENKILVFFKTYVNELAKKNELEYIEEGWGDRESYASLAYWSKESSIFQGFCEYLDEIENEMLEESYPSQAQDLLHIMVSDTISFRQKLSNYENQKYLKIPILCYIDPHDFIESLDKVDHQLRVGDTLRRRYELPIDNKVLLKELSWLKKLKPLLEKEVRIRKDKISGYRYHNILKFAITPSIEKLQQIEKEDNND